MSYTSYISSMTGSERTKLCQVLVIQIINNEVLV